MCSTRPPLWVLRAGQGRVLSRKHRIVFGLLSSTPSLPPSPKTGWGMLHPGWNFGARLYRPQPVPHPRILGCGCDSMPHRQPHSGKLPFRRPGTAAIISDATETVSSKATSVPPCSSIMGRGETEHVRRKKLRKRNPLNH